MHFDVLSAYDRKLVCNIYKLPSLYNDIYAMFWAVRLGKNEGKYCTLVTLLDIKSVRRNIGWNKFVQSCVFQQTCK